MRFYNFLTERKDTGSKGKKFENILMQAFDIVGLQYETSSGMGKLWDIRPIGKDWIKVLGDENVNIKVSGTKWLFGTAELGKMLPWEEGISTEEEKQKYEKQIKKWIKKKDIHNVYFMKPKDSKIQKEIISAVSSQDKERLNELLVKKNFQFEKLGNKFNVELTTREDGSIGYISVLKNNKQFMHSERPRKVGGSSSFVTFRTPSTEIGKAKRRLKEE